MTMLKTITRNIAITTVCIILGIMLAWQYKSVNYNQEQASFQNMRLDELREELIIEQNKIEKLLSRNEELLNENKKYESISGDIDKQTQLLKDELLRTRIIAGLETVKGKGIVITLDNSDTEPVFDDDILMVLNELRAADAQALCVNDERIVAMSEVRGTDTYIMINGKKVVAPFIIKAIADPDKLENSLRMTGGVVETLEETYQLKLKIEKSDNIVIPKVKDDGSVLKYDSLTPVAQN